MRSGRALSGLAGVLGTLVALVALTPLPGCGGGNECEQDFPPPSRITTVQSTYTLERLSSNVGIASLRWENRTTGASGAGTVTRENRCVPFFGCGTWSVLTVDIPLAPGANEVYVFETSDGCEWRDDYVITRT